MFRTPLTTHRSSSFTTLLTFAYRTAMKNRQLANEICFILCYFTEKLGFFYKRDEELISKSRSLE